MNNTPTPDTDDLAITCYIDSVIEGVLGFRAVPIDDCRKLERERDEAREQIKELIYIAERAIALAEIDFENDKFGVVSELRDGLERIKEGAK
jgi:hypothetical protein